MKRKRFISNYIYDKQNDFVHRSKFSHPPSDQVKLPIHPETQSFKLETAGTLPVIRDSLEAKAIALSNQRHLKLNLLIHLHFEGSD